ncbi:MAG: hypothetical protein R2911_37620 [Caldilineaceae bacterium]
MDKPIDESETTDLTVGQIYKALPQTSDDHRLGELRVFDDTGEDYLFPVDYFELYGGEEDDELTESLTIQLSAYVKNVLRAEARASQKSMGALLREWIDERLDLPEAA